MSETPVGEMEAGRDALTAEIAAWGVGADDVDWLLWEATAYPFASAAHVAGQLADIRRRSGGDLLRASLLADLDFRVDTLLLLRPAALAPPTREASVPTPAPRAPGE